MSKGYGIITQKTKWRLYHFFQPFIPPCFCQASWSTLATACGTAWNGSGFSKPPQTAAAPRNTAKATRAKWGKNRRASSASKNTSQCLKCVSSFSDCVSRHPLCLDASPLYSITTCASATSHVCIIQYLGICAKWWGTLCHCDGTKSWSSLGFMNGTDKGTVRIDSRHKNCYKVSWWASPLTQHSFTSGCFSIWNRFCKGGFWNIMSMKFVLHSRR